MSGSEETQINRERERKGFNRREKVMAKEGAIRLTADQADDRQIRKGRPDVADSAGTTGLTNKGGHRGTAVKIPDIRAGKGQAPTIMMGTKVMAVTPGNYC